jgi:hypothetical protein
VDLATVRKENLSRILRDRYDGATAELARAIERDDAYVWQLSTACATSASASLATSSGAAAQRRRARPPQARTPAKSREPNTSSRACPVVGTAQLGDDGFHLEYDYPAGHGEGFIPTRRATRTPTRCA